MAAYLGFLHVGGFWLALLAGFLFDIFFWKEMWFKAPSILRNGFNFIMCVILSTLVSFLAITVAVLLLGAIGPDISSSAPPTYHVIILTATPQAAQ